MDNLIPVQFQGGQMTGATFLLTRQVHVRQHTVALNHSILFTGTITTRPLSQHLPLSLSRHNNRQYIQRITQQYKTMGQQLQQHHRYNWAKWRSI